MIEFEINGQKIEASEGTSIIEAADTVGVYIPRFCYHNKLSVAANCRMCLVEVEKVGKPLPACATPITAGMKVFTASQKAIDAQKAVMEYLLINHPLDCPICDQGGECELQDLAMGYGSPFSNYDDTKRSVYNEDLGPLIETEMTRCILCTRCVRFGEEIAGRRELGVVNRGENEKITTYVRHMMQSELSGNIIDICPVGALTAKPSRYTVRGWELVEHGMISPHDCVGSNLYVHSRFQEYLPQRVILRVVPKENENINQIWLSDRDRFSYEGIYHHQRVPHPLMKKDNQWQEISWREAFTQISERVKDILTRDNADALGAIASPSSTLEEFYVLQKFMRGLGSNNVDHRTHQIDFSDQDTQPLFPQLGINIPDIENMETIVLIGSDIRTEQPLLSYWLRRASQKQAKIIVINPKDYLVTFAVQHKIIHANILYPLTEILSALQGNSENHYIGRDVLDNMRALLQNKTLIILGPEALNHVDAAKIRACAKALAQQSNAVFGELPEGANCSGAWLAGCIPHRTVGGKSIAKSGIDARRLLTNANMKAFFLLNLEPEYDTPYPAKAYEQLKKAELVVCLNSFRSDYMEEYADFILPVAPFTETDGTFVNIASEWQSFEAASLPHYKSKPAWQIFCKLAEYFNLRGFPYTHISEIRNDIKHEMRLHDFTSATGELKPAMLPTYQPRLTRLLSWPAYRIDNLVRRADALQRTMSEEIASIFINELTAKENNLIEGELVTASHEQNSITLPMRIDNSLADYTVLIYAGLEETIGFDFSDTALQLKKEGI